MPKTKAPLLYTFFQWKAKATASQVKGAIQHPRLSAVLEGADGYELELASDLLSVGGPLNVKAADGGDRLADILVQEYADLITKQIIF